MPLFFFAKFCQELSYAEDFVHGRLHLNPVKYFTELEDGADGRADEYEATSHWYQPTRVVLKIGGYVIPPGDLAAPVVVQVSMPSHLLCLYAAGSVGEPEPTADNFSVFKEHMRIPEQCLSMGQHAAVVTNVTEFTKRFVAAARQKHLIGHGGLVEYFDPATFHGRLRPFFSKRDVYRWQREYRFVVHTGASDNMPLTLDVGSLEDICVLMDTSEINSKLQWSLPEHVPGPGTPSTQS